MNLLSFTNRIPDPELTKIEYLADMEVARDTQAMLNNEKGGQE